MRAFRQQQQQKALDRLNKINNNSSSEEDSSSESDTPVIQQRSRFAALQVSKDVISSSSGDSDSDSSDEDVKLATKKTPVAKCQPKKKNPAQPKKKGQREASPSSSSSDDGLDEYLEDLRKKEGGLSDSRLVAEPSIDDSSSLGPSVLKFTKENFDLNNELKRLFGAAATMTGTEGAGQKLKGRRAAYANEMQQRNGRRYWLLPEALQEWPCVDTGMELRLSSHIDEENDDSCVDGASFELTMADSARAAQEEYFLAVASHNPNALYNILNRKPFHVDACLALASTQQDGETGFKFVKRAVHGLQCSFGAQFSPFAFDFPSHLPKVAVRPNSGPARSYYRALLMYAHGLMGQGCFRTAAEVYKLTLVSGLRWKDPAHALLHLDLPPVRAKLWSFLHDIVHSTVVQSPLAFRATHSIEAAKIRSKSQGKTGDRDVLLRLDDQLPSYALAVVLAGRLESSKELETDSVSQIKADWFAFPSFYKDDPTASVISPLKRMASVLPKLPSGLSQETLLLTYAVRMFIQFPGLVHAIAQETAGSQHSGVPHKSAYRSAQSVLGSAVGLDFKLGQALTWEALANMAPFCYFNGNGIVKDAKWTAHKDHATVMPLLERCAAVRMGLLFKQEGHIAFLHSAAAHVAKICNDANSVEDRHIIKAFRDKWAASLFSVDVTANYSNIRASEFDSNQGFVLPDWLLRDEDAEAFMMEALRRPAGQGGNAVDAGQNGQFYRSVSRNPLLAFLQTLLPFDTDPDATIDSIRDRVSDAIARIRGASAEGQEVNEEEVSNLEGVMYQLQEMQAEEFDSEDLDEQDEE